MDVLMDAHMDTHVGINTDVHMDVLDVHLDVHNGRRLHSCRHAADRGCSRLYALMTGAGPFCLLSR